MAFENFPALELGEYRLIYLEKSQSVIRVGIDADPAYLSQIGDADRCIKIYNENKRDLTVAMLRLLLALECSIQAKVWPNTFVLHGANYTVLVDTSTWTTPHRFTFGHYDIATKSTKEIKPWNVKYRLLFAPVGIEIEQEDGEFDGGGGRRSFE